MYSVSEFAGASELPILARFGLVFALVLLNELASFFRVSKLLSFEADTKLTL